MPHSLSPARWPAMYRGALDLADLHPLGAAAEAGDDRGAIDEAKKPETRAKRVAACVAKVSG